VAGRKVFTSGEILTAADVNSFLMDQSVMVFADSSARSSAIPTPTEGMVTYVEDANRVEVYDGAAFGPIGGILQVVSTIKTDTFSSSSTSFTDITGLSATITPSSTASKIYVVAFIEAGHSTADIFVAFNLDRDGTAIAQPAGGTDIATLSYGVRDISQLTPGAFSFLDSPATTSALTYNIEGRTSVGTFHVNRSGSDSNRRAISSITLFEVAV
jgi:hypothetical protein